VKDNIESQKDTGKSTDNRTQGGILSIDQLIYLTGFEYAVAKVNGN